MCDLDKLYTAHFNHGRSTVASTVSQALHYNWHWQEVGETYRITCLCNEGERLHYTWNEQESTFDPKGAE